MSEWLPLALVVVFGGASLLWRSRRPIWLTIILSLAAAALAAIQAWGASHNDAPVWRIALFAVLGLVFLVNAWRHARGEQTQRA